MTYVPNRVNIPGTNVSLDLWDGGDQVTPSGKQFVVSIYFDNNFWDYKEFHTEAEAKAFMANPLEAIRPQPQPEPEIDRSYLALGTKVSRGRRVAPKPHQS